MDTPAASSSSAPTDWLTALNTRWTALAQRDGVKLLPESRVNEFASRVARVTTHVAADLSTIVFLGLKIQMQTAAELLLDFVDSKPKTPLPETLDILELLERFVDKQFHTYIYRDLRHRGKVANGVRARFEDSHMEAALRSRLCENDIFELEPRPLFSPFNMDRFFDLASGREKPYFVESLAGGKPRFRDAVFANLFAAKWLAKNRDENRDFLARRLHSARRTVMRYLFDRILARDCPLHVAALHDDVAGVRRLLQDEGVDADERDLAGRTALHLAAVRKTSPEALEANRQVLDLLLEHTSDVDAEEDLFAGSALLYADMSSAWPAIDALLCEQADSRFLPSTSANLTGAAMLSAILEHDLDALLGFCLDRGLSVEYRLEGRDRLLTWACRRGNLHVATLLVARGADVNGVDGDFFSPLLAATFNGNVEVAAMLIQRAKRAADLEASQSIPAFVDHETRGTNALHVAARNNSAQMCALLLREGADPRVRDAERNTALHHAFLWKAEMTQFGLAVDASPPEAAVALLASVAPAELAEFVNAAGRGGETAMHGVAVTGDVDDARLLVRAGARVTTPCDEGRTPLMVAARRGHLAFVEFVLDAVDPRCKLECVNARDGAGRTAMHWAALGHDQRVMTLLVQQGAADAPPVSEGNPSSHDAGSDLEGV